MEEPKQHTKELSPTQKPASTKPCRYCHQNIHTMATVCQHCQRHQKRWVQYFENYTLLVSVVILIISSIISYGQLREASKERYAASEAMNKAQSAINKATEAANNAKDATYKALDAARIAHNAQCNLIRVGFELVDISNNTFYIFYRIPPGTTEEERSKMFGRIDALKKRLKEEHSKSNCPYFPEIDYPTKKF